MKLFSKKQSRSQAFIRHYTLPLVVFLTGACVLVIELAAIRILSPYFGNTLYTTSSVLGVILAALSLGYYIGGRLADKHPREAVFYTIILLGGVATLFAQVLTMIMLPILGFQFSVIVGPLLMSLLMFFLPAFLLGMLSPFVIKLQTVRMPTLGTGTVAGEVFFWSTLGSIAGSLTTGFVLVPFFGLDNTMLGAGVILTLVGALPLLKYTAYDRKLVNRAIPVAIGLFLMSASLLAMRESTVVYSDDGLYERLIIRDGTYNGQPTRFFQQDRSSSSAMYLNSDDLVYDYTKYYELYKGVKPDADHSLVIGGAAYSVPKALLADSPDMKVDVSEIEPSLEELGEKYFNVPVDDPRLKTHITDGRRHLVGSLEQYDFIFSDVYYSLYSIPAHFTTREFFEVAKSKMSDNGVFMANLIGDLSPEKPSFIMAEFKTFKEVFPSYDVFAVTSPEAPGAQNIMMVGYNGDVRPDFDTPAYTKSDNDTMRTLAEHRVDTDAIDFAPYPTLTDNYAPVEYLMSRVLRDNVN